MLLEPPDTLSVGEIPPFGALCGPFTERNWVCRSCDGNDVRLSVIERATGGGIGAGNSTGVLPDVLVSRLELFASSSNFLFSSSISFRSRTYELTFSTGLVG